MGNIIVRGLILNLLFFATSQIRDEKGEFILDYVTELENAVDELLKKVSFLESKIEELEGRNNDNDLRQSFTESKPDGCKCDEQVKVLEKVIIDERLIQELDLCKEELNKLQQAKTFTNEVTPTPIQISQEMLNFKHILQRELDRYSDILKQSDRDQLQKELDSARSFKDLSEVKSKLSSLKFRRESK